MKEYLRLHKRQLARVLTAKERKKRKGIPDVYKVAVGIERTVYPPTFPTLTFPFTNNLTI